jgi:hypothetical protein
MLELILFYILQNNIQGYDSHFLCARVMVFSGMCQQNFAGAGHMYWCDFWLKKCVSKIYDAIMRVLPPPTAASMAADAATITARLPP